MPFFQEMLVGIFGGPFVFICTFRWMAQLAFKVQNKLITSKQFTQTVFLKLLGWEPGPWQARLCHLPSTVQLKTQSLRRSRKGDCIQCSHIGKRNKEVQCTLASPSWVTWKTFMFKQRARGLHSYADLAYGLTHHYCSGLSLAYKVAWQMSGLYKISFRETSSF